MIKDNSSVGVAAVDVILLLFYPARRRTNKALQLISELPPIEE